MRSDLISRVRDVLLHAGFHISRETRLRPISFDLVARRDDELLIVKVLRNVDSLSDAVAQEIRVLAEFLNARPLLVGERSSSRPVEDGVMYVRHGIPIMTGETLREFLLEGVPPLVYAAPGGFYVNLNGARLREIREERGLSLGQVADAAGVSRRAISMYEQGMGAMVDVAARLEEYLDEALVLPVDPLAFEPDDADVVVDVEGFEDALQREVFRVMGALGFRLARVRKGPFQGLVKDEYVILTGTDAGTPDVSRDLARKAQVVQNICEVTESFGAFFVERRAERRITLEGVPLVSREELSRLDAPEDVRGLIEERRRAKR